MTYPYYAPDFDVRIEGLFLAANVRNAVIDLTYDNNLETADMFTLRLNNANGQLTDSPLMNVGKDVEIYMGYANALEPMMLGEITAIQPSFPQSGVPTISITGYDKSHRMRHGDTSRCFHFRTDDMIVRQLALENLLIPAVLPALMPARSDVRQTGSDWTLAKELADRNFYQLYVYWDKLYFRPPPVQTEMITLEWGKNLSSFSPRLSTSGQFGIQIIQGYDPDLCQKIMAVVPAISIASDLDDVMERLGSNAIEQLVKLGRNVLRSEWVHNQLEAMVLAKSVLKQILDGLYEGTGSCIGLPKLRAGDQVNIQGLGKRFSGRYTLSKVTHTISEGGYQTSFEVTQKSSSSLLQSLRKKLVESSSPNRQKRQDDIVIGKVIDTVDPKQQGRIKISFPYFSECSAWARLATPMAGSGMGFYFLPDVGDEVLVAFEKGDVDSPLIIGSVWNGCRRPPSDKPDPNNNIRKIKSKAGHILTFDDTPNSEEIRIEHSVGSTITLKADGNIEINPVNDVIVNALNFVVTDGSTSTTISGNQITGAAGGA